MNNSLPPDPPPSGPSLGVNEVLFILFRRKWLILAGLLAGLIAAAVVFKVKTPLYYSSAKLLVRYITDAKGPDAAADPNEIVRSPELRGNAILNSEVEILTSQDSLLGAARKVGADKVLAGYGGGTNEFAAARILASALEVTPGKNSAIISVRLGHKDPQIAQTALHNLLREYLARHVDAHRASGTYEFLQEQTEQIRFQLRDLEEQLRSEKAKVNVTSLPDAKSDQSKWRSELEKQISDAEAELAQVQARISVATNSPPARESFTAETNTVVAEAKPVTAPQDLQNYKSLAEKLTTLRAREVELLSTYKDSGAPVQQIRQQITLVEKALKDLGVDPSQVAAPGTQPSPGLSRLASRPLDLESEKYIISALQARIKALTGQLAKVDVKLRDLNIAEGSIVSLERRKELTEDLYKYFSRNLERARIDQRIDSEKLNNIIIVQDATLAAQDSDTTIKLVAAAFSGCFGAALALAFLLELFLDPSFKRPKEVENTLKVPVFAAIPDFAPKGRRLRNRLAASSSLLSNGQVPPWDELDPMLPYYEALRDRVVMSYNGDSHKPKIVGLTSTNYDAGVSRIATGLAAALSRDVQRDVLLIALERGKVAVSAFAKGRPSPLSSSPEIAGSSHIPSLTSDIRPLTSDPSPSPSTESSTANKRSTDNSPSVSSMVKNEHSSELSDELAVLASTGRNVAGASVVQSFCDLMPRLKVSDYDYIIFDLPPIDQTSGALRLASQMERTILVSQAGRSSREQLKKAKTLLQSSGANVFAVLNKVKQYGPKALQDHL